MVRLAIPGTQNRWWNLPAVPVDPLLHAIRTLRHLIRSRAQAPLEMAAALQRGEHLGMLVDQHFSRGADVTFFGRRCKANPSIARLARQFDCPVVGVRVIRLPNHRFRIAAEGPFDLPRDPSGRIDVQQSTQMITSVIERWVRENPDQWLWFHRRWR